MSTVAGARPNPRYQEPDFRMTFARLVTHYWSNAAFLPDDCLLDGAHILQGIPGAMVHGRLDISGPADTAVNLARHWTTADLTILSGAGHTAGRATGEPTMLQAARAATDRLAPA
ncbi:hypothetical protein [Nocardiopsis sp. CNR-923]|uniref:hypothetical protein n=1 Tax=Nocardiopsis sp. CNR-923 TaxID=1904965 RepID=UPI000A81FEF6|nr:hypothetical protein [Nocardiopsis sp. CNR-923]